MLYLANSLKDLALLYILCLLPQKENYSILYSLHLYFFIFLQFSQLSIRSNIHLYSRGFHSHFPFHPSFLVEFF